jgi:hypothetical protein
MRIGFLPSDFNPMILMLGEAEDCRALGGVLRRFARDGARVSFAGLGFCQVTGPDVVLTAASGAGGVRQAEGDAIIWSVPQDLAAGFAEQLEDLAGTSRIAGCEELRCGAQDGIAVTVSRGEYTDDFLNSG